jgi:hypothetical protein
LRAAGRAARSRYDAPNFQYRDTDIDGELIEDLTGDLINDQKSRDGTPKTSSLDA